MYIKGLKKGEVGLVRLGESGRVQQIGMSKEQFAMLQTFAAMLSQQKPLVEMSEEYDLGLIEED